MTETRIVPARDGTPLFSCADGPADGPPVIFAHALGTDHHLWNRIIPLLDPRLRLIRFDLRGHGRSAVPPPPYRMGQLVSDAEAICDNYALRDAVFVGLSLGGLIAQGLAVKRLDLVRALVLSNTAARIGTPALWADRIAAVTASGMTAIADATITRWFARDHRATPLATLWRDRLLGTDPQGWIGCAHAISGTDLFTPTASLRLPTLGIAGTEDGSTPADLVRETIGLIPGSDFRLIRRTGHLPPVEDPITFAEILTDFLVRTGHLTDT